MDKVMKYVPAHTGGGMGAVITNVPEETYVAWPDYDQLRQQLATVEAANVLLRDCVEQSSRDLREYIGLATRLKEAEAERGRAVKSLKAAGWQVVDDVACQRRLFTIHHEAEMYAATLPAPRIETLWSGYERTATNAAIAAGGEET